MRRKPALSHSLVMINPIARLEGLLLTLTTEGEQEVKIMFSNAELLEQFRALLATWTRKAEP